MARTKPTSKKKPVKPLIIVRSLSLTPESEKLLQTLRQEASDQLGWTVSMSAVARALFRYAERQSPVWAREQLFPFIEQEIAEGTVWGKKVSNSR
jgi:hypothetical protein